MTEFMKDAWYYELAGLPVHLQWFAAEDEGRTEDPTEHKIKKAREDGKVAKSPEIPSSLILLVGVITLSLLAGYYVENITSMIRFYFTRSMDVDIDSSRIFGAAFFNYFVRLSAPIFAVTFVVALAANLAQVGFLFTVKPIIPDFKKIVPKFGKFLQRSFASMEAAFNLGKALLKVFAVGLIAYVNIISQSGKLLNLMKVSFLQSFELVCSLAFTIVAEAALVMLVIAIPDYFFQRRQHIESIKMTKQEVKEERKQYEGDPLVKSRLRERMRQIMTQNMMRDVPKADVIITNPTHFAVALQWDRTAMPAPSVTAKGQDNVAAKIREVATEAGVPIVENKPLARALYAEVEIGDVIPEKFYETTALILAEIYKLNDRNSKTG